jgi:isocitrate dehydrogenase
LEHLSSVFVNAKAQVLADTLGIANAKFLTENKSPSRKVNELDNRGSHFYLALYWAEALATQDQDAELKTRFAPLAGALTANESQIVDELNTVQGVAMDIGGYYRPELEKIQEAMRPSATLNAALAAL